jgi:glycosyltransferase involved in cell wall biosynthesis
LTPNAATNTSISWKRGRLNRVLLLSRYGRLGSSSRLRCYQYLNLLRGAGWECSVRPLLSDDYVERLYAGRGKNLGEIARGYVSRVRALLGARRYDVVWIEREVLPWCPSILERAILPGRIPYVLDLDDAVFHGYDMHPWRFVRGVLGTKIDRLMRGSAVVIVGNEYIGERALAAGARHVEVLPTVVDLKRYQASDLAPRVCPVIGWIGTPITQPFLDAIAPALAELRRKHTFRVLLIGANAKALPTIPHETIAWSEDTEVESIQGIDIGVMPLPETPFAEGKCGYKLIQYMACGVPVVASPIGTNRKIVAHGASGFLANTQEEWVEAIGCLLSNRKLRAQMGSQGRCVVENHYSLDVAGPELLRILTTACSG